MKRFLCLSALVASLVMLLTLGSNQSFPAETNASASPVEPIKVLDLRFKTSTDNRTTTVDGLEMQIQNTSSKPIQYMVIHAVIAGSKGPFRVPLVFGHALVPNPRSNKVEILEPGAKSNLRVGKGLCDRIKQQIANMERIPSREEIQTKINVVVFKDKTAWAAGELFLPDPTDPLRWNAASELVRKTSSSSDVFGFKYSKVSNNTLTTDCYRTVQGNMQYCCDQFDDPTRPIYVWNFNFTGDPNGHVQPNTVEACCTQSSGCCFYDEPIGCP